MNFQAIEQVADAVLYEGYVLYPYRASAVKNRQRWNFGGLFPKAYSEASRGSDAWIMQTECLIDCGGSTSGGSEAGGSEVGRHATVDLKLRCLQISLREVGRVISSDTQSPGETGSEREPRYEVVESAVVAGQAIYTWQEAIEREFAVASVSLAEIAAQPLRREFSFPANRKFETHRGRDGEPDAVIVRRQQRIEGEIEISAEAVAAGLFRLRAVVRNNTPIENAANSTRDEAALFAMASTHMILACRGAEFVSLMDPPPRWSEAAAGCKNVGAWPVLVGTEPRREFLLASPIILYDYPQIAPESAGELFDGTEIDEILTLRIMSLSDEEKQEMRSLDDRTRAILERTENLPPDQLAKLHGAIRGLRHLHPNQPHTVPDPSTA
jgi:hypothetical protein